MSGTAPESRERLLERQLDAVLPQAAAAHAAGHALGLPGGTDITVELLPAINGLLAAKQAANRLVRQLDVLLNGEAGAAKQASLCDLVAQVAKSGVISRSSPAPEGWQIEELNNDCVAVRKDGVGFYVASFNTENIASTILHALASDMLAAAHKMEGSAS